MLSNKNVVKPLKNHRVLIFEDNCLSVYPVIYFDSVTIETGSMVLNASDCVRYFNDSDGGFSFVFNLDLPAKVEASNLQQLRRSTALKNMFSYDRDKGFDIFKLLPWVITIIALLFK